MTTHIIEQIAERTVWQWDQHDKFRVVEGDEVLWNNGIEPDEVAVARAYLSLRRAAILAECQYLGCGGRCTPSETVDSMRKVLRDALEE